MTDRVLYQGDLRGGVVLVTRGPYTVEARDYTVLVDATLGALIITLPSARGLQGKLVNIKRIVDNVNAVTIVPNGVETIDGAASLILASGLANAQLVAANNAWWTTGSVTAVGSGLSLATLVTALSVLLGAGHTIVLVDSSGGNRTVTLPVALTGTVYAVKKISADANLVTVLPNGAETIDGAPSFILAAQFAAVPLVGVAGTGWFIPW